MSIVYLVYRSCFIHLCVIWQCVHARADGECSHFTEWAAALVESSLDGVGLAVVYVGDVGVVLSTHSLSLFTRSWNH